MYLTRFDFSAYQVCTYHPSGICATVSFNPRFKSIGTGGNTIVIGDHTNQTGIGSVNLDMWCRKLGVLRFATVHKTLAPTVLASLVCPPCHPCSPRLSA